MSNPQVPTWTQALTELYDVETAEVVSPNGAPMYRHRFIAKHPVELPASFDVVLSPEVIRATVEEYQARRLAQEVKESVLDILSKTQETIIRLTNEGKSHEYIEGYLRKHGY